MLNRFCIFLKDLGCNAGGSLSCYNNGICTTNGTCFCATGYIGNACLGTVVTTKTTAKTTTKTTTKTTSTITTTSTATTLTTTTPDCKYRKNMDNIIML